MKTIELFCGTKSFSKIAERLGHSTFTIDNDPQFSPTVCIDIMGMNLNTIEEDSERDIDFLWASPPCTAFSVASIGRNWSASGVPKSKNAELGLQLLEKTIQIIFVHKPKKWYIENPRGMMRKVIDDIFKKYGITDYRRITVTYCQYGDSRMKPTDIWTNDMDWKPRLICKNGSPCHVSAPRGSKTGTQGLKNAKDRSVIPEDLFIEIFSHDKNHKNN